MRIHVFENLQYLFHHLVTSLHCYECAYDGCGDPFKEENVRKKECRTTCFKSKTGTGKKIILLGDAIYIRW